MKRVYVCTDSLTGIFSAIYDAWKTKLTENEVGIALRGSVEQELFCEYVEIRESEKKALAVEQLIKRHLGEYAYWNIYHTILSHDSKKADVILGMMLEARKIPDSTRIMEHLSHPKVRRVFEISRKVSNEAHYYREIVRFKELQNGILFSEIEPRNQILSCLGEHFANRFPLENWMIYDKTHQMVMVHEAGKQWIMVHGEQIDEKLITNCSAKETMYVKLWKGFFDSIAIKERESYERQRQHLPLHYRTYVTEFQTDIMA